jgi:hypothetical protein
MSERGRGLGVLRQQRPFVVGDRTRILTNSPIASTRTGITVDTTRTSTTTDVTRPHVRCLQCRHVGGKVMFTWLAVTPEQPKKDTDNRAFNGETCQAEAVAPDVLPQIVRTAIEARIDPAALHRVRDQGLVAQRELVAKLRWHVGRLPAIRRDPGPIPIQRANLKRIIEVYAAKGYFKAKPLGADAKIPIQHDGHGWPRHGQYPWHPRHPHE